MDIVRFSNDPAERCNFKVTLHGVNGSAVGCIQDLRTGGSLRSNTEFDFCHCDRVHATFTASTMPDMWESSQCLRENIMRSTGARNHERTRIGVLAAEM